MKRLLFASVLFVLFGVVGRLSAAVSGWVTFTSSNVCISTGANLELLSISYSTGRTVFNESFLVLVDTNAQRANELGICNSSAALGSFDYTEARFPARQLIVPPIVLFSTANTVGITGMGLTTINFEDREGYGLPIKNGLSVFKQGVDAGTFISIRYRRKR